MCRSSRWSGVRRPASWVPRANPTAMRLQSPSRHGSGTAQACRNCRKPRRLWRQGRDGSQISRAIGEIQTFRSGIDQLTTAPPQSFAFLYGVHHQPSGCNPPTVTLRIAGQSRQSSPGIAQSCTGEGTCRSGARHGQWLIAAGKIPPEQYMTFVRFSGGVTFFCRSLQSSIRPLPVRR